MNNKGVTLIELVLVIIIILIIATFSVFMGRETLDQVTATEVYTEITAVREAVNDINLKKELDEKFEIIQGEHYDKKASLVYSDEADFEDKYGFLVESGDFDKLYIIYGMDNLDEYNTSSVKEKLGLDSIKHTYLVNFDKTKVDLLESVVINKKRVRTYEQIRALANN